MELGDYQFSSYTIGDLLMNPGVNTMFFYLPPDVDGWTLETVGKFCLNEAYFPLGSEDYLPPEVLEEGWVETMEGSIIEDIVIVAKRELINPTPEQLLEAFKYYYKYDAFMMYSEDF